MKHIFLPSNTYINILLFLTMSLSPRLCLSGETKDRNLLKIIFLLFATLIIYFNECRMNIIRCFVEDDWKHKDFPHKQSMSSVDLINF